MRTKSAEGVAGVRRTKSAEGVAGATLAGRMPTRSEEGAAGDGGTGDGGTSVPSPAGIIT